MEDLPDHENFDALIKNELNVQFGPESLDFSKGAILAVKCKGDPTDLTTFTITLRGRSTSFLDFFQ